jgi:hypothetical protein
MKHVTKTLPEQNASATSSTRSSESRSLEKHWTAAIFKRMQARYGHKWTSAIEGIEETAVREWSEGLGELSADQVKRGLDSWDQAWPPSLPEFRAACLGNGRNEFGLDYTPEYYRPVIRDRSRLLSSDDREARREKAREIFRQMREGGEG